MLLFRFFVPRRTTRERKKKRSFRAKRVTLQPLITILMQSSQGVTQTRARASCKRCVCVCVTRRHRERRTDTRHEQNQDMCAYKQKD